MSRDRIIALLRESIERFKLQGTQNAGALAEYAAQRAEHLARIAGQPGYEQALLAERDAVLLRAGIAAVRSADAADAEARGIMLGLLHAAVGVATP